MIYSMCCMDITFLIFAICSHFSNINCFARQEMLTSITYWELDTVLESSVIWVTCKLKKKTFHECISSLGMNESRPETFSLSLCEAGCFLKAQYWITPFALAVTSNWASGSPSRFIHRNSWCFSFLLFQLCVKGPRRHQMYKWQMMQKKKWEINLRLYCVCVYWKMGKTGCCGHQRRLLSSAERWGTQGGPWIDLLFASGRSGLKQTTRWRQVQVIMLSFMVFFHNLSPSENHWGYTHRRTNERRLQAWNIARRVNRSCQKKEYSIFCLFYMALNSSTFHWTVTANSPWRLHHLLFNNSSNIIYIECGTWV